jgi:hypothetical protein
MAVVPQRAAEFSNSQTPGSPPFFGTFGTDLYAPGARQSAVVRSEKWQMSAIFILPGVLTNAAAMNISCAAVDCSSIERITMYFLLLIIPLKLLIVILYLQFIFGG